MAIQEHFITTPAVEAAQAAQAVALQPEVAVQLTSPPEAGPELAIVAEEPRASIFSRWRATIGKAMYEAGVSQHNAPTQYL